MRGEGVRREASGGSRERQGSERSTGPYLSLFCESLWEASFRPREPGEMLRRLPGEVRRLRSLGARAVEFAADACALHETYASPGLWTEVAAILRAEGMGATVHLPFHWVDLASLDREIWEGSVRSVEAALRATAPLEPAVAVVHPANHATQAAFMRAPGAERLELAAGLTERVVAALRRLSQAAGGEAVALENLEGVPEGLYLHLLEASRVGACLDAGHALADESDPAALAGRLAGLPGGLRAVHLHDALRPGRLTATASAASAVPAASAVSAGSEGLAGVSERAHRPLGTGDLDLQGLVAALGAAGYEGPVILEVVGGEWEPSARAAAGALAPGPRPARE